MYKDVEDTQDPKIIKYFTDQYVTHDSNNELSGMPNSDFSLWYSDLYLCTKLHDFTLSQ